LSVRRAAAVDAPPWMREQGAPAAGAAYAGCAEVSDRGIQRDPAVGPARDHHPEWFALRTPPRRGATIDPDAHRLLVHGLVDHPPIFTIDDIPRFPSVSRIHVLECSGNTPELRDAKPGWTPQDTHGLLSCCE
jgi:sulfane dehydrogenase subunit SoxC